MGASEKAYDLEQRLNSHGYNHRYIVYPTTGNAVGTSMTTPTGVTAALDAGVTYQIHAFIGINITASGGTLSYQLHASGGLTKTSFRVDVVETNGAGGSGAAGSASALDTAITGSVVGTGLADRWVTFDARIDVGVAGNISPQVALSSGSATFYNYGTYMDIIPIF